MNERQLLALSSFRSAIKELKDAEVIRSHRYLGDIAEFLCADAFEIDLATNLRQIGHDGIRKNLRVQIKYGGGKKTNIDLGDPLTYEEIYVVLGKDSIVRKYQHEADFLVYKLTSDEVKNIGRTNKRKYSCGSNRFANEPDHTISLTSEQAI